MTTEDIFNEQTRYESYVEVSKSADCIRKNSEQIRILEDARELKLRIFVEAHCGERGHRAYQATIDISAETYRLTDLQKGVLDLTPSCIHRIVPRTGKCIPRPLSKALHGLKPNEVVHALFYTRYPRRTAT